MHNGRAQWYTLLYHSNAYVLQSELDRYTNRQKTTTANCILPTYTPHTAPDGSPTNLTATPTSRSVTLQWSPPPVLSRNGILTHYVVVLANETWNTTQSHSITGEQRKRREADSEGVGEETQSLTVEHLRPFTTYTWEVAAVSDFGAGPSTNKTRFETDQDGEWISLQQHSHLHLHI